MMNIDNRILMEAIESRPQYPDDYCDIPCEPAAHPVPLRPEGIGASLQPDELALHEKLLEIAHARPAAPSESFFG